MNTSWNVGCGGSFHYWADSCVKTDDICRHRAEPGRAVGHCWSTGCDCVDLCRVHGGSG